MNWLVAVFLSLALVSCGEGEPREVPLAILAQQPSSFDGTRVATRGVVRTFAEPRHYWIEDEDLNRVEILPQEQIASYLDERVRVTGWFSYGPQQGRKLTLERVETIDRPRFE